jgi:hypothetical protein
LGQICACHASRKIGLLVAAIESFDISTDEIAQAIEVGREVKHRGADSF